MKRLLLWLSLSLPLWAQPLLPGTSLPQVPNRAPETADMREAQFLFTEGQRLHREHKLARAVDLYREAILKDPGRWEYRPFLGQALEQLGLHAEALEQFDLYLAEEPNHLRIARLRLLPLMGLARWEDLEQEWQRLEPLQRQEADFYLYQGLAWLARNQPGQALKALERARNLQPQQAEIRLNLASAQILLEQFQEALTTLEGMSQPMAEVLRGLAWKSLQRPAQAEALWRDQAELQEAGLNLASLWAERGQTQEALKLAALLADRWPQATAVRLLYARLLNRQERFQESLACLLPLLEAGSPSPYLDQILGWTYLGLRRYHEALAPLERARRLSPQDPIVLNHLALVLNGLGRLQQALDYQQQVVTRLPQSSAAWFFLAQLHDRKASSAPAIQAYVRFLTLEDRGQRAEFARRRLQVLKSNP